MDQEGGRAWEFICLYSPSLDLRLKGQNKTYCRSPLRPTVGRRDDPQ